MQKMTQISTICLQKYYAPSILSRYRHFPEQAKLLFMHNTPDLILLDLMLPGLSGEELLSELRENLSSDVPVIILSAKIALADKVSLLKMGADDYITKPFEPEEVIARIQVALRRTATSKTVLPKFRVISGF